MLDRLKLNFLDGDSFFYFLQSYQPSLSETKLKIKVNAIFKRIDLDRDCKISFNEFAQAIKPIDVYCIEPFEIIKKLKREMDEQKCQYRHEINQCKYQNINDHKTKPLSTFMSIIKVKTPLKDKQFLTYKDRKQDLTEAMIRNDSTQQQYKLLDKIKEEKKLIKQLGNNNINKFNTPNTKEKLQQDSLSFSKINNTQTTIKQNSNEDRVKEQTNQIETGKDKQEEVKQYENINEIKNQLRVKLEQEHKHYPFSKLLQQIINCLKAIDNEKTETFKQCKDLCLIDAFNHLDKERKGYITSLELSSGLIDMLINPDYSAIQTFFSIYDSNKDKKLSQQDFYTAFLPTDKSLAQQIMKRQTQIKDKAKSLKLVIKKSSWSQYLLLWKTYMTKLNEIEYSKKAFAKANYYDFEKAYFQLDPTRKGYFKIEDLKQYLETQSEYSKASQKEVDILFSYLDRDSKQSIHLDQVC